MLKMSAGRLRWALAALGGAVLGCGGAAPAPDDAAHPGRLHDLASAQKARCWELAEAHIAALANRPAQRVEVEVPADGAGGTQRIEFDERLIRGTPTQAPWLQLKYWLEHEGEMGAACRAADTRYGELEAGWPGYAQLPRAAYERLELRLQLVPTAASIAALADYIKRYPEAREVQAALLRMGHYYFDKGDMEHAAKLYQAALSAPRPDPAAGAHARYRLAWVHVNLGDAQQALQLFTDVARGAGPEHLKREARRDMVYVFSKVAPGSRAPTFFRTLTADDAELADLLERLAQRYEVMDRPAEAQLLRAEVARLRAGR